MKSVVLFDGLLLEETIDMHGGSCFCWVFRILEMVIKELDYLAFYLWGICSWKVTDTLILPQHIYHRIPYLRTISATQI